MIDERINKHVHAIARKLRELDQNPDAVYSYKVVSTHEGATKEEMEKILAEHVRELRAQGHELPLQDHEFPLDMESDGECVMKDKQVGFAIRSDDVPRLDDFADLISIYEKINTYIESILPRINIEDLSGWRLTLVIDYLCTDFISISQELERHPSDREYVIFVSIPIPLIDSRVPDNMSAPYGIPYSKDEPIKYLRLNGEILYHNLDPEYNKYDNLEQYIIASTTKAIDLGFSKGFTCDGKEIKFQDVSARGHELPPVMDSNGDYIMKYEDLTVGMSTDFPGLRKFADMGSIYKKITTYIESILPRINLEDLSGWKLTLGIDYMCTDFISIPKKLRQYPSSRAYTIFIHIPIPLIDSCIPSRTPDNMNAPYGIPRREDEPIEYFELARSNRYHLLKPEYDKYDNLEQYIIASAIKAIDFGFSKGFSKGYTSFWKKIKFKDGAEVD